MKIFQILLFLLFANSLSSLAQEKVYIQLGLGLQHSMMRIKENSLAYPSGYQDDPLWQDYRKKKLNPFISYAVNIGYHFHSKWSVESGIQSGAAGYRNLVDAFYESSSGGIHALHVVTFEQRRYFSFIKIPLQIRYFIFPNNHPFNLSVFAGLSYSIPVPEKRQVVALHKDYPEFIQPEELLDKNPLRNNPYGSQAGIQM